MPLWSVEEWRARIGSCWCALGRPCNTRFTRSRGKSRRVLTLHQLLTMVILIMLLIVANLVLCAVHLKISSSVVLQGSCWKLYLLQVGLILNILFGVLMSAVQTVHHVLPHRAQASLRQFYEDLVHSFRLIGYLIQILTYPVWLVVNLLLTGVSSVFKRITENLVKSIPGCGLPPGSLRLSLIVAVVVTLQLLVSMSISRAVIFLLLMTSGDVERNPGPETSDVLPCGSHRQLPYSLFSLALFAFSVQNLCSVTKVSGTKATVLMILLLQAMAAVQTSLLMKSGDVETNPGPGLYPDLNYDDVDNSIILKEDDLREVFRCAVNLKTCYYELGIELGLPPHELDAIQSENISQALTNVLLAWLRQRYITDKYGLPTWRRLVEVVDSPAGGNNHALAKAIASEHPTDQISSEDDVKAPERQSESDGTSADTPSDKEVQSKNVDDSVETDEAEEDEEHKGEELEEILHRIQDYHGLWKFIGIELGIDIDVLNTIEKDYRQDIDCLHALIIRLPHGDDSSLTCKALVEAFQSERVSDAKAAITDVQTMLTLAWDYHEVWKSIGLELNIDEDVLKNIEENNYGYHDCLRALIEAWLSGARLTDTTREAMKKALQSERVTRVIAALPLKGKDVERLFKIKWEHYRIWKLIGTEMGIDMDTLNSIEKDHFGDRNCLRAMIDKAKPAITRDAMTKVLQSELITNAVADPPVMAEDLEIMFELKWEHYKIWKIIGTELGIDVDTLNSIERDETKDHECLYRMINNAKPYITHNTMTKVLRSERITNAVAAIPSGIEIDEILNLTTKHYRLWKSIGLELGIDSAALDAIEKNYVNDHRRLIAMIELWHISVDLKPSREAMVNALQSERVARVAMSATDPSCGVSLLKQGDYSCDNDVMVDGDVFTYPYYWDFGAVCAVKILQPVTPAKNYFEHKILCPGVVCAITIGVVGLDYPLNSQPGWKNEGIGYHADDGKLFNETGLGTRFGPTCTTGDRMGCGVDFGGEDSSAFVKVFFTKNGQQVGDFVKFKKPDSGLYPLMGLDSRGEQFQYLGCWHYLPDSQEDNSYYESREISEKGYEEELNQLLANEGHIELDISKVIITGAAGSGKTCTKLVLYKQPPPTQRQSTELIEPMDRAYIQHDVAYHEENDSEYEWIVVESGSESLYAMLAATVDSKEYKCEHEDTDNGSEMHISNEKLIPSMSAETSELKLPERPSQSSESNLIPEPSGDAPSNTDTKKKQTIERQDSKARESLLLKLRSLDQKGVCVHKVRWIHLVDSGGQSQFHDILPTFLNHTSVIIYVLKLSESLDAQPLDNYFEKGKRLGDSRNSHYDVEQILNGVIQSAYYEKHNEENERHTTKILIVGTHKDEQAGSESIDAKNSKLKKIFDPFVGSKQLEVLCHGDYNAEDILFPLDAMKRDQETLSKGREIRKRIISKGSKIQKVPISWFLLEQDLRSAGDKENNGIITIGECAKFAEAIKVSQVKSALEYFHFLNIFLYFPRSSILSEIVFTDPQVVVTIVSAFVKEAYQKVDDTEFKDFSERGEFTKSFVKSKLSRFLVPGAGFEEAEVIELLKITLVVAHIEKGRYFMPCVLTHHTLDEFERERYDLKVAPVVIKLPGDTQCVPRGFFCALVCGLMPRWKLRKKHGKLADVYKNFIQFTVDGYQIAVADTFYYVEIHVHADSDRHICRKIYEDVREALKVVVNTHHYSNELMSSYSLEFLCSCGIAPVHTASYFTATGVKRKLNCTRDDDVSVKLEEKHSVWLSEAQIPQLEFSKTMSNDEFMDYLKNKGLPERDCSKLTDNGIGANIFTELTSDDINDKDLGFSFGGRKVLKNVLAKIKEEERIHLGGTATPRVPPITDAHLTTSDLSTVYKELHDARSRWYYVGLGLNINPNDLDPIESLCRGDAERSLIKVLEMFLKRAKPKPTWQQLADALDSPGVGCGAIAEQLRETYQLQ